MESENIVCPVCTLFLRPGITLKAHLSSHPKQKVIEALVRISSNENEPKTPPTTSNQHENTSTPTGTPPNNQGWNPPSMPVNTVYPNFNTMPGNHSFIYQQFMSSSTPPPNVLNVNPLAQQIVTIPTVFNSQMMCPPYVYQQQQVIMSSGPSVMSVVPKPLPIELPTSSSPDNRSSTIEIENYDQDDLTDEPDLVSVEISELNKTDEMDLSEKTNEGSIILDVEKGEHESQINEIKDNSDYKIEVSPNKIMQGSLMITSVGIDDEIEDCVKSPECEGAVADIPEVVEEYTVKCNVDLNKSCQTQTVNNYGDVANEDDEIMQISNEVEDKPSYYTEVNIKPFLNLIGI